MNRFMKAFGDMYKNNMDWKKRFEAGDNAAIDEIIARACAELKVRPIDYIDAIEKSMELRKLQKKMINDIILGPIGKHGIESEGSNRL